MKIKKGDNVIVVSGKDKGKKGKVIKALPRKEMIVIEGVNMKKKHKKPRRANQKGQVIEFAVPLHVSNVMVVDPKSGKPTRIGFEFRGGKKVRVAKRSNTVLS